MANRQNTVSFVDDLWGVEKMFNNELRRHPVIQPMAEIKTNLVEFPDRYEITADVPGIRKENLAAKFDNVRDTVTISTNQSYECERVDENTGRVHHSERFSGTSARTIRLVRGTADYDNVSATYENGVLTINIPKLSQEQQKINTGEININ